MGDEWLWTPKPSFLSAWRALPPKETHQVLEKITLLEQDPMPDGKAKIQVKRKYQGKTVYRIRCGVYRIFYTFRDPYINLLALLRRDEDTYNEEDELDDLLRFKEGELLSFLLRLSPEQERFVSWALRATGPTQLKGGPGTGKSIVALYRIRSLVPESSPGYSTGGSERSFHASSLPPLRRKIGSGVGSLRLWGRRAPALEMPKLRGKTCPSFARS